MRAISDLKNGLPIFAILKHKPFETASKNFYFVKEAIHPDILAKISFKTITTKEGREYGEGLKGADLPKSSEEEYIIKLVKIAEFKPILVCTRSLPEEFENAKLTEVNTDEMKEFCENFIYDLRLVSKAPIQLKMANNCEFFVFRTPLLSIEHYVIKIGEPEKDKYPLVRIHSSCYTGDLLASLRCDCRDQLQETIKFIEKAEGFNGGYVLYLMQEGRGIGLANKIKAYYLQQCEGMDTVDSNLAVGFKDDERNFLPAVKMLNFFNVKEICLITNNPKKKQDLKALGIEVNSVIHTVFSVNEYNQNYLKVKEQKMGHSFQ